MENRKLEIKNLSYSKKDIQVLKNININIDKPEIVAILGNNKSGKTCLIKLITSLFRQDEGTILFDKKEINYKNKLFLGYLSQERYLLPNFTVKEIVYFHSQLKSVSIPNFDKRFKYWIMRFDLDKYKYEKIGNLSKSIQNKILFIILFINEPYLILIDELYNDLDIHDKKLIFEILNEYREKGSIIIYTSNDIKDSIEIAQRVILIKDGLKIYDDLKSEIDYCKIYKEYENE